MIVNKSMYPLTTGFSIISKMQDKFAQLQMQLGTGVKAQTLSEMGRDLPVSLSVRSRLTTMAGYNASIEQVDLRMSFYDNALTRLDEIEGEARNSAVQGQYGSNNINMATISGLSKARLDEMVTLLNSDIAGRYLFGGSILIASAMHVVQRTCRARMPGRIAPWFVILGYNAFIVIAGTGYLLGATQSKEYAEPEWYADLWLTIVWVVYLLVFMGTLWKRKEPHIYVANWFYLAFIVTIAMLHIFNNLTIPVSVFGTKSYILWAGVQDAMVQWWYGHNAVGFFLTAGFLAIMYYFIPKRADRPVYSYRLSIVHFWALIFLYIWAGPHHLHYTALPQWASTLGATFSIMLWMPSWGGMINGLMTLSGAWDKLRTDPVLRMMVVSVAFYGMSTFEGPLMSLRSVNSLSHYTDWTIGHVHSGALGWVGYISFGALYCLIPWLWNKRQVYSLKLVNWHFWISTIGIVLYICAMWVSGIMQGLMWRAYDRLGFLEYSFIETVEAMHPFYVIRALGGALFVIGSLIMAYNLYMTVRYGEAEEAETATGEALAPAE